ncbi:MAG TPA: 50S ribosomal protein L1 [Anaerolineales bacterium]|nr:50S ribosomal protein L1 [Anaerolineales bacterium]HRF49584.1 50S ribosomal protein L1 [Anaerolineales bacterium]
MQKHGKKYKAAAAQVEADTAYSPEKAVALAKATSYSKFNATVEAHIRLGVDPKYADQNVRDVVVLPNGLGKTVRVLVFAEGEGARIAAANGADHVADDELLKQIQAGWAEFDVAIATPDLMGKVGRLGRILGPRGLMPNPKTGTVVPAEDLPRAIKEAKAGRVEFRVDKTGNLHVPIGKVQFSEQALLENFQALMGAVIKAKPATAKGVYLKKIVLTATMGPGVKVDTLQASAGHGPTV